MTTNGTIPPLPNPFTPLAFIDPNVAEIYLASIYLIIAALSAYIWDCLLSIKEEIDMCHKRKISLAVVVYFVSRITTLVNGIMIVMLIAAPVASCHALKNAIGASFIVAVPSTSALFFFRVKAVYCDNKIITSFFGFLLFALFGLSFLYPFAVTMEHLGTTRRCIGTRFAGYISVPIIVNSILDTLVFVAISLRIISYSITGDTTSARISSFLRGHGLPNLSRSLLQGGQLYYFATIGLNIVVIILPFAPVSTAYHTMFIQAHIALNNAMACRVFRGIRLGLIHDVDETIISTTNSSTLRFFRDSHPKKPSTKKSTGKVHGFEGSHHGAIAIEMTKTTESTGHYIYPERDTGHLDVYDDGRKRDDGTSEATCDRV